MGGAPEHGLERLFRCGPFPHGLAERHRGRRRLYERGIVSRYRWHHRVSGLRRLSVLRRLARGVPHGVAHCGRAVAQRWQVHDGRRACLPSPPAPRTCDGRIVDAHGQHVLHDRADGGCRCARVAAAEGCRSRLRDGGDRYRRAHDCVRGFRRHARDHVGTDRQGDSADGWDVAAQRARATPLQLRPRRVLRRGRPRQLHGRARQSRDPGLHDART